MNYPVTVAVEYIFSFACTLKVHEPAYRYWQMFSARPWLY